MTWAPCPHGVRTRGQGFKRGGKEEAPEGKDQSEHVRQVKHTGLDIERTDM